MHLGFDLDEVLSQTSQMAIDHLNNKHDTQFTIDIFKKFNFDENIYSENEDEQKIIVDTLLEAIFDEELMANAKPYPDAVKTLNLFRRHGHKIFIITKRPVKQTGITIEWLRNNNFPFDKVVLTDNEDKGFHAKKLKLDCFVDDLKENLDDLYCVRARWTKSLMLMTRPWNAYEAVDPAKITRVNNWSDVLRHISIANRFKT